MPKKTNGEWIAGLTRTAAVIAGHFKIACNKQAIKRWQTRNPPFPPCKDSNRYNRKECFEWVEEHVMRHKQKNQPELELLRQSQDAESRRKIRRDEEEQFDFDVKRGAYIKLDEAKRTIIGALKRYHSFVRFELETKLTDLRRNKLMELGATPEIVALFHEYDLEQARGVIDRIELKCEEESKQT